MRVDTGYFKDMWFQIREQLNGNWTLKDWVKKDVNFNHIHPYHFMFEQVSSQYNNQLFLDCGTWVGYSAVALAKNETNEVITYDLNDEIVDKELLAKYDNITYENSDANTISLSLLDKAKLIFLDLDPHDGIQESLFYNRLLESNFSGILMLDDITLNDQMIDFWGNIREKKLSKINLHYTGFGIIDFANNITEMI